MSLLEPQWGKQTYRMSLMAFLLAPSYDRTHTKLMSKIFGTSYDKMLARRCCVNPTHINTSNLWSPLHAKSSPKRWLLFLDVALITCMLEVSKPIASGHMNLPFSFSLKCRIICLFRRAGGRNCWSHPQQHDIFVDDVSVHRQTDGRSGKRGELEKCLNPSWKPRTSNDCVQWSLSEI